MAKEMIIAIAGATGAVGNQMIRCLEESINKGNLQVGKVKLLASKRSVGRKLLFQGQNVAVEELTGDAFKGCDIALFSAGGSVSQEFAPKAVANGCVVVDNSSAWRMDVDVPLIVSEVNPHAIAGYTKKGIIANPNCSTTQMVVALKPIHDAYKIRRVIVSTYQAVSGTGKKAIDELYNQAHDVLNFIKARPNVYPHQIAFNCLPHIDTFLDNGYTKEEMKMTNETKKIMEDDSILVTATTVRVPVFFSHSESVNIETEKPFELKDVMDILAKAQGIKLVDDPQNNVYPLAIDAAGQDLTLVGRVRRDESIPNGLNMWVVADNIRKGAAANAVQIAEILAAKYIK